MHDHTIVRVLGAGCDATAVHTEVDEQTVILETGSKGPAGEAGADGIGYTVQTFTAPGTLSIYTGKQRWYAPANFEILNVTVSCGTAPTGSSIVVDINNNGASIYTNPANRPNIFENNNYAFFTAPDNKLLDQGEYLTVDIDQVGTTFAGTDLVVVLQMKER
jgi:hypothetical protein